MERDYISDSKELWKTFYCIAFGLNYTAKISEITKKTAPSINQQIRILERAKLIKKSERDQRQQYEVVWNAYFDRLKGREDKLEVAFSKDREKWLKLVNSEFFKNKILNKDNLNEFLSLVEDQRWKALPVVLSSLITISVSIQDYPEKEREKLLKGQADWYKWLATFSKRGLNGFLSRLYSTITLADLSEISYILNTEYGKGITDITKKAKKNLPFKIPHI